MNDPISDLNSEQAQRAVIVLFDRLPAELWPGTKPTVVKNQALAETLGDLAADDAQASLRSLRYDPIYQGEAARALLRELAGLEALREYVEAAVQQARTPHMAGIDPLTIFVTVVAFAAMPNIKRDAEGKWQFEWNPAENLRKLAQQGTDLVEKLTAFVKSLPPGALGGGT